MIRQVEARAFVSHSSRDLGIADAVRAALEARGVRCWIPARDFPAGVEEEGAVERAITNASLFVLVLSAAAGRSVRVLRETMLAARATRSTLVLRTENAPPLADLGALSGDPAADEVELALPLSDAQLDSIGRKAARLVKAPEVPPGGDVPNPGPYAFISYKRQDTPRVAAHLQRLREWGVPFWYDKSIPGGAEWDAVIEERIGRCQLLIVFLSRAAVASKQVRREIKLADKRDKPVLAVCLEPVDLAHGLEMLLGPNQMIDAGASDVGEQLRAAIDYLWPEGSAEGR